MSWRNKGQVAFALLGAALGWPLLGITLFDTQPFEKALRLLLFPSLALVAAAAVLFFFAARE